MKPDKPFDPNLPFTTRDGRKARLLGVINSTPYPIIAAVTEERGYETVTSPAQWCGEYKERK